MKRASESTFHATSTPEWGKPHLPGKTECLQHAHRRRGRGWFVFVWIAAGFLMVSWTGWAQTQHPGNNNTLKSHPQTVLSGSYSNADTSNDQPRKVRGVFYVGMNMIPSGSEVQIESNGEWSGTLTQLDPKETGGEVCFNLQTDNVERVKINDVIYKVERSEGIAKKKIYLVLEPSSKKEDKGFGGVLFAGTAVLAVGVLWWWRRGRSKRAKPQRLPPMPSIANWQERYEKTGRMAEGGFGQAYTVRMRGQWGSGEFVVKELLGIWTGGPWEKNAVWVRQMEWECKILEILEQAGYGNAPRLVERGGQLAGMDGTVWYAMTKARGISLKEWMAGLPAPTAHPGNLQQRLSVIYALSRAIADLHQAGVAHRDLKPENIFLDFRGAGSPCGICLIDFGSSKSHGPGFEMPSGYAVLSPYHYAPEQKRNFNRSGRAADDYVLGILSHEILSGTKPFGAKQNHAEVDRKELAESLSRNGHVSYAVASFIAMNLLNMNPVQRGMARQMLQVLESTYPNCCVGG